MPVQGDRAPRAPGAVSEGAVGHVVVEDHELARLNLNRDRLILSGPRGLIDDPQLTLAARPVHLIALSERGAVLPGRHPQAAVLLGRRPV